MGKINSMIAEIIINSIIKNLYNTKMNSRGISLPKRILYKNNMFFTCCFPIPVVDKQIKRNKVFHIFLILTLILYSY